MTQRTITSKDKTAAGAARSQQLRRCFAYPSLGAGIDCRLFRLGGTGLGNLLFTWARCLVQARRYGLQRIHPTWPQLCRRPWLHSEPDKRTYHDLFHPSDDELTGLPRLARLVTGRFVSESALGGSIPDGSIVVFRGMEGFLQPVLAEHQLVRTELLGIVTGKHARALSEAFSPDIAIHVRLGDFQQGNSSEGNHRIGLDWYIGVLQNLRASLGPVQIAVFSDGTDDELAPLLSIEGVRRVTFGSSIADILALSQARVLVTSGSTFSMWSAFLGQHPTIWFPGRLPHPIFADSRKEISTYGEIPSVFIAQCEASLSRLAP